MPFVKAKHISTIENLTNSRNHSLPPNMHILVQYLRPSTYLNRQQRMRRGELLRHRPGCRSYTQRRCGDGAELLVTVGALEGFVVGVEQAVVTLEVLFGKRSFGLVG